MTSRFDRWQRGNPVWRAALYGLFWSIAINVGEALSLPLGLAGSGRAQVGVMALIAGDWWVIGTALAVIAARLEPGLDRSWKLALLVLLMSVAAAVLIEVKWWVLGLLGVDLEAYGRLGTSAPSWANFCYILWMTLFHGGLFVIACVLLRRAERNQRLLGNAQIARRRTEALLDEAELDALSGRVDPAFLWRAMAAVQARYACDADSADQLLDRLVAFLRKAMPIVRSGHSSLKTEVSLARDYAGLSAALASGGSRWQIEVEGQLPDLAFPPLLLLPMMDHFESTRDGGPPMGHRVCLHIEDRNAAPGVAIVIETDSGAADATEPAMELPYRLQVALRQAFGDGWSVQSAADGAATAVVFRLHLASSAEPISSAPRLPPVVSIAH